MLTRLRFDRFAGPLPAGAALVTRATIFGNPWVAGAENAFAWPKGAKAGWRGRLAVPAGKLTATQAVRQYSDWLERGHLALDLLPVLDLDFYGALRSDLADRRATILRRLGELRGRDLACTCQIGAPCHAEELLEMANRGAG